MLLEKKFSTSPKWTLPFQSILVSFLLLSLESGKGGVTRWGWAKTFSPLGSRCCVQGLWAVRQPSSHTPCVTGATWYRWVGCLYHEHSFRTPYQDTQGKPGTVQGGEFNNWVLHTYSFPLGNLWPCICGAWVRRHVGYPRDALECHPIRLGRQAEWVGLMSFALWHKLLFHGKEQRQRRRVWPF